MTNSWQSQNVLVTGATGFIGSHLARKLIGMGAHVVLLVRDWDPQAELIRSGEIAKTTVVHGALEDFATVARAINENEVETVFHLAAQSLVGAANRDPLATFETNIRGTYHLLEACRRFAPTVKRVIVASSDKAYGESDQLPYIETHRLEGKHPYDVSKSCGDLLAQTYAHTYSVPLAIARCANVYGPGDTNWSRLIPGTIRSLVGRTAPLIRSDGELVRDYLYVDDVVDAYLRLAEQVDRPDVRGQSFNFGTDNGYRVLEIVQRLQELTSTTDLSPVLLREAKFEIQKQTLNSVKARAQLGWSPRIELGDGLRQTIAWYRERYCPS
ncbi:MAG: GDP-mannose 4,6-dehydratase [Deltaproteobacteria bacterium]|nr:GDP-mannose 4,6-dehydratase [Deltaproteobacteria bacterium]